MNKIRSSIIAVACSVLLFCPSLFSAYHIKWHVLGGGGTTSNFSDGTILSGTAVQTAVGNTALPSYTVTQGYWNNVLVPCKAGDADGNGTSSISDAVFLVNYIFASGPAPNRDCAGDADGNGFINISDVVWLVRYIFFSPGM